MRMNPYKMLPAILLTLATIPTLASAQFDFGQVVEGIARGAAQEGFNRLPVEQIFEGGSRNRGGGRIENHVIREPKFPTVIRDDNTAAIVQGITYAASQILSDTECRSHHTRYCDGRGVDRRPITPVESGSPAERHFARAQVELKNRNYVTALKHADAAADLVPDNHDIQQLRSLIYFAQGRYRESASLAYQALHLGPGWNWTTIHKLMGSVEHYNESYQVLGESAKNNPDSVDYRFLLGYHYLMLGHVEAGTKELEAVDRLIPRDRLVTNILAAVSGESLASN